MQNNLKNYIMRTKNLNFKTKPHLRRNGRTETIVSSRETTPSQTSKRHVLYILHLSNTYFKNKLSYLRHRTIPHRMSRINDFCLELRKCKTNVIHMSCRKRRKVKKSFLCSLKVCPLSTRNLNSTETAKQLYNYFVCTSLQLISNIQPIICDSKHLIQWQIY